MHLNFEYAGIRNLILIAERKRILIAGAYVPLLYFGLRLYPALANGASLDLLSPGPVLGLAYGFWLSGAMLVGFWWQLRFAKDAPTSRERTFHKQLATFFAVTSVFVLILHFLPESVRMSVAAEISTLLSVLTLVPFAVML